MLIRRIALSLFASCLAAAVLAGGVETPVVSSPADGFAGFYLGAGLGMNSQTIKRNDVNDPANSNAAFSDGSYGAVIQGMFGYGYTVGAHWLLAGVINGEYDSNNASKHVVVGASNNSGQVGIGGQLGISFQAGYVPFERNMYYLGVGPEWGWFSAIDSQNGVTVVDSANTLLGVRAALGAKQLLTERVILAEELAYTYYESAQMSYNNNSATIIYRPTVLEGIVSVSYRFAV